MKGERIAVVDDNEGFRDSFTRMLEAFGEADEHVVVGNAGSVEELKGLLEGGLRPTVIFLDDEMPDKKDGDLAAELVRKLSPETIIIGNSSHEVKWSDYDWGSRMNWDERIKRLKDLQH